MKKLFVLLAFVLSVNSMASNEYHGNDFQKIKEKYGKSLSVEDKTYIRDQAEKMLSNVADSNEDPIIVRKRFVDSVYAKQDDRYWIMGFPWLIHKEAVSRVLYDRNDNLLVTEPKMIKHYTPDSTDYSNVGKWLVDRYIATFDYRGNLLKLVSAVNRFEQGICTPASNSRDTFTDGTEVVAGVVGWVTATAVVLPVDPSFGVLTTFVAQPGGWILGSFIGIKVGEAIYDHKCLGKLDSVADAELEELIAYH